MEDSGFYGDVVLCFDGDRNTKKVRFKDGVEEETVVMAVVLDLPPKLSWKDMLLGEASHSISDRNGSSEGSENDFDFL
ncbi:hypothetical protein PVK06_007072 [Gossypium arboreum]|uniref:Uncharacterized protein n=1 Tax=Gossypium arboreum TaxID=29729 RepID=A0ABR0QHR0_GOSAR|nr:hypothetical protein PVK06_007072 [Gossypium arboreum]